ncbi:MAG: serine/threonine protein kinase [Gammaproteobacteria bacterium]|nr:serine/threonine protein kinase [Gammaproteobacteria bacterium]MBU1653539.1 serine/threonine protein kinase [Gammaproteobacteria bacterium]MBU1961881.1 serine/threonine protein kinase [Gammaproteobacteria bacterium]
MGRASGAAGGRQGVPAGRTGGARQRYPEGHPPRTNRAEDFGFGLKRYLDEAKALARFQHPNIVRILDHLEAQGTAYIVMEYEEGETLAERLKRGRGSLSEAEILDLCLSLLQGLREVHKAGLLHRDIKPGNIFLRKSGEPLLIDFGAARHALGEHSKSISAIVSGGYAPPEQYSTRGRQGPFTDLYAIGAVLYELITGKVPLESVERSHHLSEGEPDPLSPASQAGNGKAPEWLLSLNDHLLRVPSKERPQDCDEVLQEIRSHRVPQGALPDARYPIDATARPQGTRLVAEPERFGNGLMDPVSGLYKGREKAVWVGSALMILLLIGLSGYLLGKGGSGSGARPLPTALSLGPAGVGAGVGATALPEAAADEAVPQAEPHEAELFTIAGRIDTGFGYQLFLRKFPQGPFSAEARRRFEGAGR